MGAWEALGGLEESYSRSGRPAHPVLVRSRPSWALIPAGTLAPARVLEAWPGASEGPWGSGPVPRRQQMGRPGWGTWSYCRGLAALDCTDLHLTARPWAAGGDSATGHITGHLQVPDHLGKPGESDHGISTAMRDG